MSDNQGYSKEFARHWIDGAWLDSAESGDSVDPATGETFGRYPKGGRLEAERAIAAAARAFASPDWRSDAFRRATALSHLADAWAASAGEMADAVAQENGKVRDEAVYEAIQGTRLLRFSAGLPMSAFGRVLESRPGIQSLSIREPLGVAGLLIPWNGPIYLFTRALAAALAAGCTAVVKMPARAAHIAALLSRVCASVEELPQGAVNVFIEEHSDGSRLLVDSPVVKTVSFTGSTAVGRDIAASCGKQMKRAGLELGGKTPHVIFDDADLDALLPVLRKSLTMQAGQFCITASRILVQRGLADRLRAAHAAQLEAVRVGPSTSPDTDMGPLIDKAAVERVDKMVEEAIGAGAKVIVRGGPAREAELARGAFYRPTLLEVNDPKLPIVQQEVFGPVQTLQVFDTEEEAIALANDCDYGLSACVWSRDADRPLRVARLLEAGIVAINNWAAQEVEMEDGGYKASGLGRLGGLACLDDFTDWKNISQTFASAAAS